MLSRFTLGARMGLGLGVLLLLALLPVGAALLQLVRFKGEFDHVAQDTVPRLLSYSRMSDELQRMRRAQLRLLIEFDGSVRRAVVAEAQQSLDRFWQLFREQARPAQGEAPQAALRGEIEQRAAALKRVMEQVAPLAGELSKMQELRGLVTGDAASASDALVQVIDKAVALSAGNTQQAVEVAEQAYRFALVVIGLVSLCMMLAGVAVAVWLTRATVSPLRALTRAANRISQGELSVAVHTAGQDELAQLGQSFAAMQGRLRDMLAEIRSAGDAIQTAADEISGGNDDLSVRTEQQAASLQATSSKMQDITGVARQCADDARNASAQANATQGAVTHGATAIQQAVQTMDSIDRSSARMAEIIGVIDGIAFQTGILALNASVEAARAGEQGRGFAVVAGEVRRLAQSSAQAATEIAQLIRASREQVVDGTRFVRLAEETFGEVQRRVHDVAGVVDRIQQATAAQSQGIEAVHGSMAKLDDTTQRNAALAEQVAAAAGGLRQQATRLGEVTQVFK